MPRTLTPLDQIFVPSPRPDETYRNVWQGETFEFHGLKALLGAADVSKAGDRHAGLAAASELEREAARTILSSLSLGHLYERPLVDSTGRVDDVMRVNYDVDRKLLASLASLSLGEFKDRLLRDSGEALLSLGSALTGPMAAAVAKLCDVHELVYLAHKLPRVARARTTLGLPGTLASRLQPNHPTDDLRGVTLLVYWGLSLGAGDALIGVNPAVDTVDNVEKVLKHLDKLRRATGAPTQICVLAHIKTQLACLARGAPVEILFQSLAGTESTLTAEFDVTVELLDHGYRTMLAAGPLREITDQMMYFETGQGSEFTYGKHEGLDMTTAEALCYGLARRYDPFMVNNVTGFIGPETHRDNFEMILANLQDHFMGKLLGLPMGMAPCYTLHSLVTLDGQQMATQMLTAAGANYYMDVALNTDRMLAYFDSSGHDDQTLREVYDRRPAPEYLAWARERGIFSLTDDGRVQRGPAWGQPRRFCATDEELAALVAATPSVHGFDTAGPRPADEVSRRVRMHQAVGRAAIRAELDLATLNPRGDYRVLQSAAVTLEDHLNSPALGSRLCDADRDALGAEGNQVQLVVSDGLSAAAVMHNVPPLVDVLSESLAARGIRSGQPIIVLHGRVKIAEQIAALVQCELLILLIGERPGGDVLAARSLSAYLVYRPAKSNQAPATYEYTVVSNIHSAGLHPLEAAAVVAQKVGEILQHGAAGNRLEGLLAKAENPAKRR